VTRKTLGVYGSHGHRVRCYVEGGKVYALWRDRGDRKKRSWPDSRAGRAEAKAWAETFAAHRVSKPRELVRVGELWRRYQLAEWPLLRPKTRMLYADYWRKWQVFVGPDQVAEDMGPGTMAEFRRHLDQTLGPTTVHRCLQVVKTVYAWGYAHEHLSRNAVRDYRYKVPKEKRPAKIPEYRAEEFAAILAQLPLSKARTWRAGGALALCGLQGARVNAVLHLRWEDVDLEAGTVRWRPEWDKLGRDETSPLRPRARAVLEALRPWTQGEGWLFPAAQRGAKGATYTVQALIHALHEAERRAGLRTTANRGTHSLRRMVFNDVLGVTGDLAAAMASIRDTSLQVASKYLRDREDRVRAAFARLDTNGPETAPASVSRGTAEPATDGVATGYVSGGGEV